MLIITNAEESSALENWKLMSVVFLVRVRETLRGHEANTPTMCKIRGDVLWHQNSRLVIGLKPGAMCG
jgi:hypothetical protein